jgi:hypothetical protein
MTGHYDINTNMYILRCNPVLSASNRDYLIKYDSMCFSFIGQTNLDLDEISSNALNILGYQVNDLLKKSFYNLVDPLYLAIVKDRHMKSNY